MKFLVRLILRYSGWIVLLAVLATIPSIYFTAKLYGNLRPDLEELLPRSARSVTDLGEIRERLQSIDNLAVLVFSEHTADSRRFIEALANKLQKLPPGVVSSVEYRIDRELKFFSDRKALFLETKDLSKIRDYVRDRIDYEKALYNPLNIFSEVEIPEPKIDIQGLLGKYEKQADGFSRFPGGFYATPDEKKRVLLAYLPASNSGISGLYSLKHAVEQAIRELNPQSFASDLKILYTGGVQNTIEEHSALIEDIEKSAEIVLTVVTLALYLFFRSWLATAALFASLFMARFWTFGAAWWAVGYLNANSAFMGSIVLGSGITFGIILLSRYLEERRNGRTPTRAAWISIRKTARATWTAALAAGLAYGSLFLTEFEGFRQYGVIGLIGMMFCWISSILLFPALLLLIERWKPLVAPHSKTRRQWLAGPMTALLGKYPGWIFMISTVLTVLSIASFVRFDPNHIIETNLSNLRNKKSMTEGSGYLSKYLDEIFQRYLSPVVVLAREPEDALRIAQLLKKRQGENQLISSVRTIHDFLPSDQANKIKIIREIQAMLPPKIFARLSPEDKKKALSFLNPAAFKPVRQEDLPELVLRKFTEKDGSIGKLVLVEPPLNSGSWSGAELNHFVHELRESADEISKRKVPVAGGLPITSDMIEAIGRDGPKATLFAFLSVVVLIMVLFRKPSIVSLMLFALIIGNLWLFGFILGTGFKINFLNFIALPITFGIGVDYGVNVFHRYLHEPSRNILKVVRETGAAVGLCSFTTITGYSSLLIAGNQAFVSFGVLAILGEVTTLLSAILTLPAFLLLLQRFKERERPVSRNEKPA